MSGDKINSGGNYQFHFEQEAEALRQQHGEEKQKHTNGHDADPLEDLNQPAGNDDDIDLSESDIGVASMKRVGRFANEQDRAEAVAAEAATLAVMNKRFAVVNDAGKVVVMKWRRDHILDRLVLDRITFDDFQRLFLNRWVEVVARDKEGNLHFRCVNLGKWWLGNPKRRQFTGGITFDPTRRAPAGYMNLWRDFAVTPAPGDWSLLKRHIENIVCRGVPKHADYYLDWMALAVQHPEQPAEVALGLRGKKGCGKGIVGRWFVKMFAQHGLHLTDVGQLVGRFNAHLRDCCALFGDEAFVARDKQHEGRLKALITEPTLVIEGKGQNIVVTPNMLHIILATNNDWLFPASVDERRLAMFELPDDKIGDYAYFAAIDHQMHNGGGLAAMLHELLHRDISGFNVRVVPQTEALKTQKTLSLPSLDRWWLAVLEREYLYRSRHGAPWFAKWHNFYTTELLERSYLQWCEANRVSDRDGRSQLGTFFTKLARPGRPRALHPIDEIESIDRSETRDAYRRDGTLLSSGRSLDEVAIVYKYHPHGYKIGPLEKARASFTKERKIDTEWGRTTRIKRSGPESVRAG